MKKIFAILLAALMLASLTACGGSDDDYDTGYGAGDYSDSGEYRTIAQVTFIPGNEYDCGVNEGIVFKNPNVPASSTYAYSWYPIEGEENVELEKNGSYCTIKAVKTGRTVIKANLDYHLNGRMNSKEETFVINITKKSAADSYSSSGSYSEGVGYGNGNSYTPAGNSNCTYCGGVGYTLCSTCMGKGYYDVHIDPIGSGNSETQRKECPSYYCDGGKRDCPHC